MFSNILNVKFHFTHVNIYIQISIQKAGMNFFVRYFNSPGIQTYFLFVLPFNFSYVKVV